MASLFENLLVMVRGGGDLGSGVAYRLHRAGFKVVITELASPVCVRRLVSYGTAVYEGAISVDGVVARLVPSADKAEAALAAGDIAVLVDDTNTALARLTPVIVVDARMVKRNLDTTLQDAPLVIALGPGFEAGVDCHAVVETNRGHYLGRVIWHGPAQPDTGEPGRVNGVGAARVLRAPADGHVAAHKRIGDRVRAGEIIAEVQGQAVQAAFDGVLRGIVHPQVAVRAGMKIGDLDPRAEPDHCFTISDKSLAIGGGVLEAVFSAQAIRSRIGESKAIS